MRSVVRRIAAVVIGLGAVTGFCVIQPATAVAGDSGPRKDGAAVLSGSESANVIPDRYIVVAKGEPGTAFGQATKRNALKLAKSLGVVADENFSHAINGFAANLTADQLQALRNDASVRYVSADQTAVVSGSESPAPWSLGRLSHRSELRAGTYTWASDGTGVNVYVIDSGIRRTHFEFNGRVAQGVSIVNDGRGTDDCTGHGTHVAGIVGGNRFGVAKNVTLVPVRVINCSGQGSVSNLIAGIDWVTANHKGPSVANVSLSVGTVNKAIDDAIARSVASNVTYVVAAGNQTKDACGVSPARASGVISVGSTDESDSRATDSNYGKCVSVFAPGVSIQSSWNTSDTATAYDSGTSMASPHVAGLAALYLEDHRNAKPSSVATRLKAVATPGVVQNAGPDTPNRLAFSAF